MAGYIPAPINPAKGASVDRLFTGTGPDAANWQPLDVAVGSQLAPIALRGGTIGDGTLGGLTSLVSGMLDTLSKLGGDTSAVPNWQRGFDSPMLGPTGWFIWYGSSFGATGPDGYPPQWEPIPAVVGGELLTDAPKFDPRSQPTTTRYLVVVGGAVWLDHYHKFILGKPDGTSITNTGINQALYGWVNVGRIGNLNDHTWRGITIYDSDPAQAGATVTDWDYRP